MSKQLLHLLNLLLVVAIVWLGGRLYQLWGSAPEAGTIAVTAAPAAGDRNLPGAASPVPDPAAPLRRPRSDVEVVAERNLFSPARSEATPEPMKAPPKPPVSQRPRFFLHGVVFGAAGGARAFLEDPRTRKVTGYHVGDTVGDSRLDRIEADRVVLRRGDEEFEVLLRDPSKPRPPAPSPVSPTGQRPAGAVGVPVPPRPGVSGQVPGVPGGVPGAPPPFPVFPEGAPGMPQPPGPVPPGLPLPPDLPGATS